MSENYTYMLDLAVRKAIAKESPEAVTNILSTLGFIEERVISAKPIKPYLDLYDILRQTSDVITTASLPYAKRERSQMTTNAFNRLYPRFLTKEAMDVGGKRYGIDFSEYYRPEQVLKAIFDQDEYDWLV